MAVEGIISIVEVALNALAAAIQLIFHILVASTRPWRYLLSSSYRATINARYKDKSQVQKLLAFASGGFLVIVSMALVIGCVYIGQKLYNYNPNPPSPPTKRLLEAAANKASAAISKHTNQSTQ